MPNHTSIMWIYVKDGEKIKERVWFYVLLQKRCRCDID